MDKLNHRQAYDNWVYPAGLDESLKEITCPHNKHIIWYSNDDVADKNETLFIDFIPQIDAHYSEIALFKLRWEDFL
jgi:hypothetical protein